MIWAILAQFSAIFDTHDRYLIQFLSIFYPFLFVFLLILGSYQVQSSSCLVFYPQNWPVCAKRLRPQSAPSLLFRQWIFSPYVSNNHHGFFVLFPLTSLFCLLCFQHLIESSWENTLTRAKHDSATNLWNCLTIDVLMISGPQSHNWWCTHYYLTKIIKSHSL